MNINGIGGTSYSMYSAKSTSKKETPQNSFKSAVESRQNEITSQKTQETITPYSEEGTGTTSFKGSYAVTDEQAAYFRDEYGDDYDGDKAEELYYQLADNGIISENDAGVCTGTAGLYISVLGDGYLIGQTPHTRHIVKDVSFTDPNSSDYGLWDDFLTEYDRKCETWSDDIERRIAFEHWRKERCTDLSGLSQQTFDSRIKGLENTLAVIKTIFG